jgi:hypothetical protein
MKHLRLLPVVLGTLVLHAGQAKPGMTYLYTYQDARGNTVINNLPPVYVRGQGLVLRHVGVGHVRLAMTRQEMARVLKSPEMLSLVDSIATAEGVDPYLARAVIQAESAFYAKARSRTGALGLMQLMPQTAKRFGVLDPFDPNQNITGGVKYLKWLTDHFQGDLPRVVAAYNAGEGAVEKHKGIPPFAETRAYVPRVMELYTKRLVQPDPRAAGSMTLLKKGRGGFEVDEKAISAANPTLVANAAQPERVPSKIFQWVDASGRLQVSDQPPPKGVQSVKTFEGASN